MGSDVHTTADSEKFQVDQRNIRARRLALGLTQDQFASVARVSVCTLSYAERDLPRQVGELAFRKIEDALTRIEGRAAPLPVGISLFWDDWLKGARAAVRRNVAAIVGEARP